MIYTTLISTEELAGLMAEEGRDLVIVDCRFALNDTEQGRRAYAASHIPGAVYAHLDEDLSGPIVPGQTSRHPLPPVADFAHTVGRWGIGAGTQVVTYDDAGGAMAARLWWMLRWVGHDAVAVLDGGWPAWIAEDRATSSGTESRPRATFIARPFPDLLLSAEEVLASLSEGKLRLIDARSPERFRGESEPNDPVAGHIPGAVNHPFPRNLEQGRFRSREELAGIYSQLVGEKEAEEIVFYCGSGVTAAHNALAMLHAGLGAAKLYPGSWSEWITDTERPVERGE